MIYQLFVCFDESNGSYFLSRPKNLPYEDSLAILHSKVENLQLICNFFVLLPASFMDGPYEESNDHYLRLRLYWKLYGHNGSSWSPGTKLITPRLLFEHLASNYKSLLGWREGRKKPSPRHVLLNLVFLISVYCLMIMPIMDENLWRVWLVITGSS